MKKLLTLGCIAALALAACTKEKDNAPERTLPDGARVFSASIETASEAKTTLEGTKVNWASGDKVDLLWEGGSAPGVEVVNGKIAATVGEASVIYAVYPAGCASLTGGTLSVTIPEDQGGGSFGETDIMVAKLTEGEAFAFKHLCGLLKFTLNASNVTAVKIKADNEAEIVGTGAISFNGDIPAIDLSEGKKEITLTPSGAGTYYAAVAPGVTLGGFYFELTTASGVKTVFSPKDLTTTRGSSKSLGTVDDHIVVDWFVTPEGAGKKNGVSWENAFGLAEIQSLYEGQMTAEDIAKYDQGTFHFAGGTYSLGKQIKFDFTKASDVVTIHWKGGYNPNSKGIDTSDRNVATYETVFDGTSSEDGRAMRLDCRSDISFDGISVKNFTSGLNTILLYTGNSDKRVKGTFTNCVFKNNGVTEKTNGVYYGGVFYLYMGELTVVSCTFEGNTSIQRGGAIAAQDAALLNITGTAENKTVFHNNTAAGDGTERGGAIMLERINGSVNISYAEFAANSADNGGAISQMNTTENTMTTNITSCLFDANGGYGAVLEAYNAGPQAINLTDCIIKNNTTRSVVTSGGAVVTIDGADTEVTNNSAYVFSGKPFTVKNGTFSGNTSNVFYGDATVVIDGGNFIGNSASYGGVIFSTGNVTINGGTFQKNTSSHSGGVIHVKGATGNITINGGLFGGESDAEANTCSTNGGVVYLEGSSNVTIKGGTFKYNKATTYGGAIGVGSTGTVTITGGTFDHNSAVQGGAIRGNNGNITISSAIFSYNSASANTSANHGGGAILFAGSGSLEVNNTSFIGNSSQYYGGAIGVPSAANHLFFNNCKFTGNGAKYADCFSLTGSAYLALNNCAFWGNVWNGTGISAEYDITTETDSGCSVVICNSTIIRNGTLNAYNIYNCKGTNKYNSYNSIFISTQYAGNRKSATATWADGTNQKNNFYIADSSEFVRDINASSPGKSENSVILAKSNRATWVAKFSDGYKFSSPVSDFTNAGLTLLTSDVSSFVTALGSEKDIAFDNWLKANHGYDQDIDGNERKSPYWPGCYQK